MHIVHPSFFSIFNSLKELKSVSRRMTKKQKTHSHPSFFILQLPGSADIIEVKDEKAMMHIVNPSFSYFSSLRVLNQCCE